VAETLGQASSLSREEFDPAPQFARGVYFTIPRPQDAATDSPVNLLLQMPLEARQGIVFALGLLAGTLVNWGIYALAWHPRPISHWSRPPAGAPPRQWSHFIPIVGWWLRRSESEHYGAGFWIRPMLIELALATGLALLFRWEVTGQLLRVPALAPGVQVQLHAEFVSHALLIVLMTVATFIDFDEQTIPDEVTIPGTILALVLAAAWPVSLLPIVVGMPPMVTVTTLLLTSPNPWQAWLNGPWGMALGCGSFALWCLALVPAVCTLRRGPVKGVQFYLASVARYGRTHLVMAVIGVAAIAAVWAMGVAARWEALLTALVGMAFGGLLVWAVRIVGQAALHKEAMGFGDVTLMAMIGAFLGWQLTLVTLVLASLAGSLLGLGLIAAGRGDMSTKLPFGTFLALGCALAATVGQPLLNWYLGFW
jgi:leader peptidase (prepilin peptidase) / N-methyltransferase